MLSRGTYWFVRVICAMALVSLVAPHLGAQVTLATISGTVTDATSAAVPDASVQVKNVNTGAVQTVKSDGQGRYLVPNLNVGEYEAQASKAGFQTSVRRGITLNVGTEVVADFALQVGQQTQT